MISLVNPRSPFLQDEAVMPPLGIMYLSAMLNLKGIKAQVIDMGIGDKVPDGDLFITGTTPQLPEIRKLKRNAYTAVGGPHASIDPSSLENDFNLVITGEGEELIEEVIKSRPSGVIHAKRIRNLDLLPFPDRTNADRYHYEIDGKRATTMITSRGCNGKCSFCCKAVMDKGIYLRSPENILQEINEIKTLGYGAVMFYDDTIAINRKRIELICAGLEKTGLRFRCFVRADQVDEELFARMAQAGCHEVLIGVESGSQRLLDAINKQETVEQQRNAIIWAKRQGIRVKSLMMVGLPGESWETIEQSRNFLLDTEPDTLDITILSVYKGTDIHNHPEKYDITFKEAGWYKGRADEYRSTVSTSMMSETDIEQARELLWETFKSIKYSNN
ncbi:MAG: radical SAM protein [Desulfuromonadaceae bacterium]|nr:radical SAM protein [Desulfuromonadaceae bacterium]MDD5104179.1 radical SAM protein [Desulfuromonadaceae bacterium]